MQRAVVIGLSLAGLAVLSGCRERSAEPARNRNLGDEAGELMPVAVAPADPRILEDQKSVTAEGGRRPSGKKAKEEEETSEEGDAKPKPGSLSDLAKKAKDKGKGPEKAKGGSLAELAKKAKEKIEKDKKPEKSKAEALAELTKQATQGKKGTPTTAKAEQFIGRLAKGQFDAVVKEFAPEMVKTLPAKKLKGMWGGLVSQLGALRSAGPGVEQKAGALTIVNVPCKFARATLHATVTYDQKGKVAGLGFGPPAAPGAEPATKPAGKPSAKKASPKKAPPARKPAGKRPKGKPSAKPSPKPAVSKKTATAKPAAGDGSEANDNEEEIRIPPELKDSAAKAFDEGKDYFIWPNGEGPFTRRKEGFVVLPVFYVAKPKPKPFYIVSLILTKDPAGSAVSEKSCWSKYEDAKERGRAATTVIDLDKSLSGRGKATVFLSSKPGPDFHPISNKLKLDVVFQD